MSSRTCPEVRRGAVALLSLLVLWSTGCAGPKSDCALVSGLSAAQCDVVKGLRLGAVPAARGNAKADDVQAALLGFGVFYDARFSSNVDVRCATCHEPEKKFSDGRQVSVGLAPVTRRSPTTLNSARMETLFWDGRADSLWSQPLFAFEHPYEMDFTRLEIAHRIALTYRTQYEALFGPLPLLSDAARFPARGRPGHPAWDQMALADCEAINRVATNVGKALEAYMRKLAAGDAALDRFLDGDATALTPAQQRGLATFVKTGCTDCHSGPMLSDQRFHNLGVPAMTGVEPDRGRAEGLEVLRSHEFNTLTQYWDGPRVELPGPPVAEDLGAFRTPSLRNIALTPPYLHNGHAATLDEAIAFHLKGGGRGAGGFVGEVDAQLTPRDLTFVERGELVEFMIGLKGTYPLPPWNDWPR